MRTKMSSVEDSTGSRFYCCFRCRNILAAHDDIVDKSFVAEGGRSRAFLFSHGMNMLEGPKADRQLISGIHMVSDMFCRDCGEIVGWKYQKTHQLQHKFKEGKIVLVKSKIAKAYDSTFY